MESIPEVPEPEGDHLSTIGTPPASRPVTPGQQIEQQPDPEAPGPSQLSLPKRRASKSAAKRRSRPSRSTRQGPTSSLRPPPPYPGSSTTKLEPTDASTRPPSPQPSMPSAGAPDAEAPGPASEAFGAAQRAGRPTRPIPQLSPTPEVDIIRTIPHYYRDYSNPYVYPAYSLICHSAWFAQVDDTLTLCADCATAEHIFCSNINNARWRHFHVIARALNHTNLHCGRCYKLLLHIRRAIDCYLCRMEVISTRGRVEHLIYKVLCDNVSLSMRLG